MSRLTDALRALLGVSAYERAPGYGLEIDDKQVEELRSKLGGNLAQMPTTRIRWYLRDLESAQYAADAGDLSIAAQIYRSMRRDGVIAGLLSTLTSGIVRLPKRWYGELGVEELKARNGSRSVFDDMFPPSELSLLAADGRVLGVGVGELIPVDGRDFPVFRRLEPEFLRWRWIEGRWYYNSIIGPLPITPGDGRWVLHTPGGAIAPWNCGLWPSLGRAFINKEHAMNHRSNYSGKLANPARAAIAPSGATEDQRVGFLSSLIQWGVNSVFELPPGWDVKLIESKGEGTKVFQDEIDTCDKESAVSIAGQQVTVDGGAGFSNMDIHRAIRADIIKDTADGLAHTINTQGTPQFVARRYGVGKLDKGAMLEWDVARPRDLKAEADCLLSAANAIGQLREQLAGYNRELDINEFATRFSIPVKGDADGDGAPDQDNGDELERESSVLQ